MSESRDIELVPVTFDCGCVIRFKVITVDTWEEKETIFHCGECSFRERGK